MSINQYPSLETLPAEIIYYICDLLDTKTILMSFRDICQRLNNIINNYGNYILDFEDISQSDFQLIFRLIKPRQVKSLTLSQQNTTFDQILFFDEQFWLKNFTQIRSLTLISIKEIRLETILKYINIPSLISFSLEINEYKKDHNHVTVMILTSILTQANLCKLALNIQFDRIQAIIWPDSCTIEQLEIGSCIDFKQIDEIIRYLPRLKTLAIDCLPIENIRQTNLTPYCKHLTRLSLEKLNINIDDLECLLESLSLLIDLKLSEEGKYLDSHRWEQFIQTNLPELKKFQFYFTDYHNDQSNYPDIEQIIQSFQTPFWLELKKWFVICEYDIDMSQWIKLYSIPKFMSKSKLKVESTKISLSTLSTEIDKDAPIVVGTDYISFDFTKLTFDDIEQQRKSKIHPLLRTKKHLTVIFGLKESDGWISFISFFIDLSTISKITLIGRLIFEANGFILTVIKSLLKQACNVRSISLCSTIINQKSLLTANDICWIIPAHVRHLEVTIKNFDEAKIVLEQLEHVSSVHFYFDHTPCLDEYQEWFGIKNLFYQTKPFSVYIWRKKVNMLLDEQNVNNKRIKLADDHQNE